MGRPFEDKTHDYDAHMLPFDGTYDYVQMMRKLDEYGYAGPLTLEVGQNRPEYLAMSPEEFLATCYERIKKISEM
jgi:sugar phosphate isomerase/epimerase